MSSQVSTRDVNETRETRDLKKFLGIENFISHGREFQAAGPHARSFNEFNLSLTTIDR